MHKAGVWLLTTTQMHGEFSAGSIDVDDCCPFAG